ncbi:ARM repeat-containing protein [Thelephora ganbajun]|uniref:ARM repeat-containing protein n=1 Tax=Thelephora ganbajun TaxID=370292 RepID=A0ACB6ZDD5_THEGA|nr:ARM repeat-containing protein [Thelephora ganbajun]
MPLCDRSRMLPLCRPSTIFCWHKWLRSGNSSLVGRCLWFVRHLIALPALSQTECLIMLLYCTMTFTGIPRPDMSFALPNAINLAEMGQSVSDKRIGYLFCIEVMPPDHPTNLLLVNTLRKDLESPSVTRVCLALDTIIQYPLEDIIPAVQTRLYDILSHNSPHVRRRALLALRALSRKQQSIIEPMTVKVQKRLRDLDSGVANTALILIPDLVQASLITHDDARGRTVALLLQCWKNRSDPSQLSLLTHTLSVLCKVGPPADQSGLYHSIVKFASQRESTNPALLFQVTKTITTAAISPGNSSISPITYVRHLVGSTSPNDKYLLLCLLEVAEPRLWAGTDSQIPAVLDAFEVELIMQQLDSPDGLIRRKTLKVLYKVEPDIVVTYFSRMVESVSSAVTMGMKAEYSLRMLQVAEVLSGEDSESYAQYLMRVLKTIEGEDTGGNVIQEVVEYALTYVRTASFSAVNGVTVLLTALTEENVVMGPTFLLIAAALACEYSKSVAISPESLLWGLSARLSVCTTSVKEVCVLAMLRLSNECEEVPEEVIGRVKKMTETAGKFLRRRYDQFLFCVENKDFLRKIVSMAKSSSLPDFALSIEISYGQAHEQTTQPQGPTTSETPSLVPGLSPPQSPSQRPLRYDAYEAPPPARRLNSRSPTKYRSRSSLSARSSSQLSVDSLSSDYVDPEMAKTMTAGELALMPSEVRNLDYSPFLNTNLEVNHLAERADLIALDSPFIADLPDPIAREDPGTSSQSIDFESIWNSSGSSNSRGWCEQSSDDTVRLLQKLQLRLRVISADQPPFKGELKIVAVKLPQPGPPYPALLRIKESEDGDESCLWRMRCLDNSLRLQVKHLLESDVD